LRRAIASLPLLVALVGCGGGSSHTTTMSKSTPSATANVSRRLPGSGGGTPATAAAAARLRISPPGVHTSFSGLENLTVGEKLDRISTHAAGLWAAVFQNARLNLPPATVTIVDQVPASCDGQTVSSADPPRYCIADATILLPLAFMTSNVAPIGDAALALVVADQYSYHVEAALHLLGSGSQLSLAESEKADSCLSGIYFTELSAENHLQGSDEAAVNKVLADKAGPAAGGVSAAELTAAFNTGLRAGYKLAACVPPGVTSTLNSAAALTRSIAAAGTAPAPARGKVSAQALRAHAASSPADFLTTPAIATGWIPVHIGQWDYKVPPDHSYTATGVTPSGIDITSTAGAHFDVGIVTGSPSLLTLDQISALEFSTGSEDTPGTQAQITAIQGPSTGPAGSQDELIAWTGTRQDGTAVTGLLEIEDFGYGFVSYVLGGPSASWATDLPILLAIKANTAWTPPAGG
jgi:hypothetical protein